MVRTAACAACSIGSDLCPPPTVPKPATPKASASIPLPSRLPVCGGCFAPSPEPEPPLEMKSPSSSPSSEVESRHAGPPFADDELKTAGWGRGYGSSRQLC